MESHNNDNNRQLSFLYCTNCSAVQNLNALAHTIHTCTRAHIRTHTHTLIYTTNAYSKTWLENALHAQHLKFTLSKDSDKVNVLVIHHDILLFTLKNDRSFTLKTAKRDTRRKKTGVMINVSYGQNWQFLWPVCVPCELIAHQNIFHQPAWHHAAVVMADAHRRQHSHVLVLQACKWQVTNMHCPQDFHVSLL